MVTSVFCLFTAVRLHLGTGTQLQSDEDAVLTKVCNVLPFDSASPSAWIFRD